jgi:hypothetical protein
MKEEALKLADELQDYMASLGWKTHQAPEMIRRLVEELKAKNNYLAQHCEMIDQQSARIVELEKGIPSGLSDPKSYYQGYEDGVQSLTVTDPRPVAFMKDFGGFTDDPVLAIQDGFNIPVYVTKADYQKIKQKKPCDAPQTKPLSDEEIMKEWDKAHRMGSNR